MVLAGEKQDEEVRALAPQNRTKAPSPVIKKMNVVVSVFGITGLSMAKKSLLRRRSKGAFIFNVPTHEVVECIAVREYVTLTHRKLEKKNMEGDGGGDLEVYYFGTKSPEAANRLAGNITTVAATVKASIRAYAERVGASAADLATAAAVAARTASSNCRSRTTTAITATATNIAAHGVEKTAAAEAAAEAEAEAEAEAAASMTVPSLSASARVSAAVAAQTGTPPAKRRRRPSDAVVAAVGSPLVVRRGLTQQREKMDAMIDELEAGVRAQSVYLVNEESFRGSMYDLDQVEATKTVHKLGRISSHAELQSIFRNVKKMVRAKAISSPLQDSGASENLDPILARIAAGLEQPTPQYMEQLGQYVIQGVIR